MLRDYVGRLAELHRRLVFPFCGDDFRATLALGLGFFCHCPLHIVGQNNVFNLDHRYLGATLAITQRLYEGARIRLDPDRQEMSRHWDSRTHPYCYTQNDPLDRLLYLIEQPEPLN